MAGEHIEVAVQILYVHGLVNNPLGAVNQYGNALFVANLNDFLHGIYKA